MDSKLIFNIVALGFIVWFFYSRFAGVKGLRDLSSEQLQEALASDNHKIALIDVREPGEVKQGYIPGAVNIPLSSLGKRVAEIPRDRQIYLYCRSGMRSKQAARILRKHGFSELSHLKGGIMSWKGKQTQ
ncbi:rhodanese-like domain-containing protein [Paenibacillus roseipurpureus]|uniref:Rhodanese-like domain-containing protein n=1 Tax=Paenibacillus roseopurpureus TaxID=2918901 RepID=A0AA96LN71_9BACL|nr:rhodanese-like domain-containing protein [Paenibacillus sp. MBLB1832]WNR45092.1 rhodanese-like domain-containing protein [Paenibacillus sp. MBLB1832]